HTSFKCDWSSDVCSSDLVLDGHRPTSGRAQIPTQIRFFLSNLPSVPSHMVQRLGFLVFTQAARVRLPVGKAVLCFCVRVLLPTSARSNPTVCVQLPGLFLICWTPFKWLKTVALNYVD